jgi:hypothetical protein
MANLIGTIGVALLLGAFLLNLLKRMGADGYAYSALNLAGAALASTKSAQPCLSITRRSSGRSCARRS